MMERDATKRLTGRIEIDDAYLGGERNGGKRGRVLSSSHRLMRIFGSVVHPEPLYKRTD
jgi:hypothetical protein